MHDGSLATIEDVVRLYSLLDEDGCTPTARRCCGR